MTIVSLTRMNIDRMRAELENKIILFRIRCKRRSTGTENKDIQVAVDPWVKESNENRYEGHRSEKLGGKEQVKEELSFYAAPTQVAR